MKREKLQTILASARDAIRDGDHQKLYQVIADITDGVSSVAESKDAFVGATNRQPNKIVPISVRKNK